jgi:hypothetical protein
VGERMHPFSLDLTPDTDVHANTHKLMTSHTGMLFMYINEYAAACSLSWHKKKPGFHGITIDLNLKSPASDYAVV